MNARKQATLLFLLLFSCLSGACGPEQQTSLPSDFYSSHEECLNPSAPSRVILLPIEDEVAEAHVWDARDTASPTKGIIFVSGVDGGFVQPADEIYSRIGAKYAHAGVPSVFVKYRKPGELEASVADAVAAANHLKKQGVKDIAILGWSFGGAVMTHATLRVPEINTVIGFAPQALDTEPVASFTRQSLLLIHSDMDENVPFESSEQILNEAPAGIHKKLVTLSGADHLLTGQGDHLAPIVSGWLNQTLHVTSRCSE